jgi:branched-chain amino acid transport system substrate-binding protein
MRDSDIRITHARYRMSSWGVTLGIASALAVTACGSGSSAAPKGPILIGSLVPITGPADLQTASEGAEVALKLVNAAGGVLGRQVQYMAGDDHLDPVDAIPVAQKFVSVDHAVAMIANEGTILGVQRIFDAANIPAVIWGGTDNTPKITDPLLWRLTPGDSQLGVAMADYAYTKGYRHPVMLFGTDQNGAALGNVVKASWAYLCAGCSPAVDVNFAPAQTSYRSEIESVLAANPDVILFRAGTAADASVIFKDLEELHGLTIPMIGDDGSHAPDVIQAVGLANIQKVVTSTDTGTTSGPGYDIFTTAYQQEFGHGPVDQSTFLYDGMTLLCLAIEKAGTTDGSAIAKAIPEITNPAYPVVYSYAQGLAMIKAGKNFRFTGVGSALLYNQYHQVYGPWGQYKAINAQGSVQQIGNLTPDQIRAATPPDLIGSAGF